MNELLKKFYSYDETAKVWHRGGGTSFSYSDGDDTENSILDALQGVADRSMFSADLYKVQKDWASTYHFSALRGNLLRPLHKHLSSGIRVLELGCGCGAITRYLGECGGDILAVEGSARRARIAALRCADLPNVTVLADRIQDIPEEVGAFDVVTLVGVLEYARVYGGGKGAELQLLRKARSFLKDDGVFFLALENKLGLKYLAGVPEDHTGISWGSVVNAYHENGVMTYSRKELEQLLLAAGFNCLEQFVPIPDYKLPVTVITPEGLQAAEEYDLSAFFGRPQRPFEMSPLFNLAKGWKSVVQAGLLKDLADSMCFVAHIGTASRNATHDVSVLVEHYGNPPQAQKKYAKKVVVRRIPEGIGVFREHLYPPLVERDADVAQVLSDEPYFKGTILIENIRNVVTLPNWTVDELAASFAPWVRYLQQHLLPDGRCLPSSCLDLTPFNLMVDVQGDSIPFDQEWDGKSPIALDAVVVRGIIITLGSLGIAASPENGTETTFDFLVKRICAFWHMEYSDEDLARFWGEQNVLDAFVWEERPSWEIVRQYALAIQSLTPDDIYKVKNVRLENEVLNKNNEALNKNIEVLKRELLETKEKICSMQNSLSWRITEPLRKTKEYIKNICKSGNTRDTVQQKKITIPHIEFENEAPALEQTLDVSVLAYYLPQFHAFKENDLWWGKGFTEWTNVQRAVPYFSGHVQPQKPHPSIGFYDLGSNAAEIFQKQITLAQKHGISGFCFHHYWFSGKRLMEKPVDALLAAPDVNLPFCLNWANENWTRRWDGRNDQVLIAQGHSPEDDIAFIRDAMRYFADSRYIRIRGRPILLIYHAALFPNMAATLERWRETCIKDGEAEPYCVMVQSFTNIDPRVYGFDAAAQFPPHAAQVAMQFDSVSPDFTGELFSYDETALSSMSRWTKEYPLFPGVMPAWDNTPRRMANGRIFLDTTPHKYETWLRAACNFARKTLPADERFVFINAWNEWGEGAHLEPSEAHGFSFLNATGRGVL